MAGGTIPFDASGYLEGKIEWSSTSNGSNANTSNVTATLKAHRTNSYTTQGRSWSGYVKIQGKDNSNQVNINFPQSVTIGPEWYTMAEVTLVGAKHNNDGTGSVYVSGSVTGPSGTTLANNTSSGGDTCTLDKIARYATITSFTVSKRNETSFTFNWGTSDTIDYLYYSTNDGSSWTGYDVSDGTSGSFTVSGLSPNTTYKCKIKVRRKDSQLVSNPSSTVSQTTYKVPTQTLSSKTETSLTMNWTVDSTADYIWYSKDNGSNWTAVGSVNATSGSYTISGLTANTFYNIKTRVRRSSSNTTYDTSASSQTTYDYPYCTETPNFTIGDVVTLKFYNPLRRTFNFYMICNGTQIANEWTFDGTSYSGLNGNETQSRMYATIPNSTNGKYQIKVVYSSSTKTRNNGNTFSIKTSECYPTFSNFTYQDIDSDTTSLTGNNQIVVNGYSNITATISTSNKAVAKNSATMVSYKMTIGNKTTNAVAYSSSSSVNLALSDVNSGTITIYATDSRGLSTSVTKTATFKDYTNPVILATTAVRSNNGVGQTVTLSFNGTYWNKSFGSVTNSMTVVKYYYKETTATTWQTGQTTLSVTTSGANWSGSASIQGDLGANGFDVSKSFNIKFEIKDQLITKTKEITLGSGTPAISVYQNNVAIGAKYDTDKEGTFQVPVDIDMNDVVYFSSYAGALIKFPTVGAQELITVKVVGNGYESNPIEGIMQSYRYSLTGSFIQARQTNLAGSLPQCKFMVVDNVAAIYIPTPANSTCLFVTAYSAVASTSSKKRRKLKMEISYHNSEPDGTYKSACTLTTHPALTDGIGTWTPVMENCTVTYTTRKAIYTKIGSLVLAQFQLRGKITAVPSSPYSRISGLPYKVYNTPSAGSISVYSDCLSEDSSKPGCFATTESSKNWIFIQKASSKGLSSNQWKVTSGSSFYLEGTVSYITDQ